MCLKFSHPGRPIVQPARCEVPPAWRYNWVAARPPFFIESRRPRPLAAIARHAIIVAVATTLPAAPVMPVIAAPPRLHLRPERRASGSSNDAAGNRAAGAVTIRIMRISSCSLPVAFIGQSMELFNLPHSHAAERDRREARLRRRRPCRRTPGMRRLRRRACPSPRPIAGTNCRAMAARTRSPAPSGHRDCAGA